MERASRYIDDAVSAGAQIVMFSGDIPETLEGRYRILFSINRRPRDIKGREPFGIIT